MMRLIEKSTLSKLRVANDRIAELEKEIEQLRNERDEYNSQYHYWREVPLKDKKE